MNYKGLFVDIYKRKNMVREADDGRLIYCDGFHFEVFEDESKAVHIAAFIAAIGFELPNARDNSAEYPLEYAASYAREVIDLEFTEQK